MDKVGDSEEAEPFSVNVEQLNSFLLDPLFWAQVHMICHLKANLLFLNKQFSHTPGPRGPQSLRVTRT